MTKMLAGIHNILSGFHDTTMFLSLMLWLCALPIVLIITFVFFGWQGAITGAIVSLVAAIIVCWGICLFPKNLLEDNSNVTRPRVR